MAASPPYALTVLTLACVLSYLDSGLIALLMQPIKQDLQLSDTQLGLLTGIAFSLFYATLGVPLARWADCGNRPTITSLALAMWSVAVMACLFVTSFTQLMLVRVCTAVGDAGVRPPTYSLLGDCFSEPAARTRAMAIYWSAGSMAALLSFVTGGWLNELYGWRATLALMGLPGLLVAALVKWTIAEPRQRTDGVHCAQLQSPRMLDVVAMLWRQRSTRHLTLAIILMQMMTTGLSPWFAAFMIRNHGMGTGELGVWLGLIVGLGGLCGALLGGYVAGRYFAHDERKQMRMGALSIGSLVVWFAAFLLIPHKHGALLALVPMMLMLSLFLGPTFALLQRLVPQGMRATSLAVMLLFSSLIGMGIGPLLVGILSDLLLPIVANESLRYAMLVTSLVSLWSGYHLWQVGGAVENDLRAAAGRVQFAANAGAQQALKGA